ncbi:unnamed protein product [Parnassius apollo]|uniref:(apollo) hypothetical protein n=1 Tax=Parnassius apollo TaxID=110799 RepID=A0A8S3Y6I7_PARAO|nr:unnamed protein product [Parnassius apollo]
MKLIDYIKNSDEPDKVKLEEFITALANATFETFESVPDYNGIPASKYMELILNLAPDFNPSVVIGATGLTFEIVPTITEMGLCYAMNSMIAVYNSPSYRARNKWDYVKPQNETFSVHPLDGQVFAQLIDISTAYKTIQEWYLGTNLQWGIATYPRMRYRRDIIFGFTDVLVAVGGMAGLFLGCSVLSFMEIAYFCTLRFYWYLRGR